MMKKIASFIITVSILCSCVCFAVPTIADPSVPSGATTAVEKILGFIQWVGYAIAVGMLIYIGIKYMMASANEKADLKSGSIKYVIGAIVVAAAATICGWITDFGVDLA